MRKVPGTSERNVGLADALIYGLRTFKRWGLS